jgi:hypothetical protein
MRAVIIAFSLSSIVLSGCGFSNHKQNHLGLVVAPHGVSVDSAKSSNPAPIALTSGTSWKRSWSKKQAETKSIDNDAPYNSLD